MGKTTTIRITQKTYSHLKLIADNQHSSMQDTLDKLVEEYEDKKFFETLSQSVANLKKNPAAWDEELVERGEWDRAMLDGLEDEDEAR